MNLLVAAIEKEQQKTDVPAFKVGGWITPPDRWWNETTGFAEFAEGAPPFAETGV